MTDGFNEDALWGRGFRGFKRFADLDLLEVPREPGVYAVLRGTMGEHQVLETSVGGRFKGKNPSAAPAVLRSRLASGSQTLYLGKADTGTNGTRGLRKRIGEFTRFGRGEAVGHWGGRYIWQLSNSQDLRIAWLPVTDRSAAEVESELLSEYFHAHAQLPFANLRR
jgi:hypothetical protein